jgi:hypothetical protein
MDQEDPKEKRKRYQREWIAKRRAEDPVFREKQRQATMAWREANRDELNAEWRRKYASDEEYREKCKASSAAYKRKRTFEKHGLSQEDYEGMLARQHGACGICEIPFQRTPRIDHCHVTGLVRGLLCNNCNLAIGNLKDNPSFAYRAGAYLERWVRYLWQLYNKEGNAMSSIEDASEKSKAAGHRPRPRRHGRGRAGSQRRQGGVRSCQRWRVVLLQSGSMARADEPALEASGN